MSSTASPTASPSPASASPSSSSAGSLQLAAPLATPAPHRKRLKRTGLLGLGEGYPRRVSGVEQRAVWKAPEACDKCGNRLIQVWGREVHCPSGRGGCGRTWFLVKADGGPELLRPDQEQQGRGGRRGIAARRGPRSDAKSRPEGLARP